MSLPKSHHLIYMLERLCKSPSIQEVLWSFYRVLDEKQRLTLMDNPHFYVELPTSPEAYGDGVQIDPSEDFRHANKFYVLIDKSELVHVVTGQVSQFFGNFWRPKHAIIFKGWGIFCCFSPFLMSCQTSAGGSGGKALLRHLRGAHSAGSVSGFRFPPS
jgi:hypothetical protein